MGLQEYGLSAISPPSLQSSPPSPLPSSPPPSFTPYPSASRTLLTSPSSPHSQPVFLPTSTSPPHLLSSPPSPNNAFSVPSRSRPFRTAETMMDMPLAEAVVKQLGEVVERLSLNPRERHALDQRVELTGEALQEALVFVAARSKHLDELEEELEQKEMLLEMRELVVAAEVERQTQRLEELSAALMEKMDTLQALHDALIPDFIDRFQDTVKALKDATEGEEEARYFMHLLDRREGTKTPSEPPSWPESHPCCGKRSRGASFRVGKEEVFLHATSGEVWVRVRPPDTQVTSDNSDASSRQSDVSDTSPFTDRDS